jgi:Domain of unknown function (DUF4833)
MVFRSEEADSPPGYYAAFVPLQTATTAVPMSERPHREMASRCRSAERRLHQLVSVAYRGIGRRGLMTAAGSVLLARSAFAARRQVPLFRIERSKNANIVQYDAVVENEDKLASPEPVVAYWILKAEDGRHEPLSSLQRRAYGFKVVPEKEGSWLLYMNATRDRALRVLKWQGRWVAQVVIAGKSATLVRMFVESDESAIIPRVRWVDLFGIDMVTGKPITERLTPR